MKILIIEDDSDFIEAINEIISKAAPEAASTVAKNKTSATAHIKDSFFDLIILDLNIPITDDSLDGDPTHGHSVLTTARLEAPGTPVIVLTGSSAEEFIPSLLGLQEQKDVWGSGSNIQLVALHKKHKLDAFPSLLNTYTENIASLRKIELRKNGTLLSETEDRIIRIFSRKVKGASCAIRKIGGGLSSCTVYRLAVSNEAGELLHDAVCKIGSTAEIRDEDERYTQHVARLRPDATPRKLQLLEHGAKNTSGVFYGLAMGFTNSVFDQTIFQHYSKATTSTLEAYLENWRSKSEARMAIKDIRRRLLNDGAFNEIRKTYPIPWADQFEEELIQVKQGCCHGDLHGMNILTTTTGNPIIIDYGDVGDGASSFDPITLELSFFFHPEGPFKNSEWPNVNQAKDWGNLTTYLDGCPSSEFITNCRQWALRIAAGDREIAAVAYTYLVRQLKYDGTNKKRIISLLDGVKAYYDQT